MQYPQLNSPGIEPFTHLFVRRFCLSYGKHCFATCSCADLTVQVCLFWFMIGQWMEQIVFHIPHILHTVAVCITPYHWYAFTSQNIHSFPHHHVACVASFLCSNCVFPPCCDICGQPALRLQVLCIKKFISMKAAPIILSKITLKLLFCSRSSTPLEISVFNGFFITKSFRFFFLSASSKWYHEWTWYMPI